MNVMNAVIADLITGDITPQRASAISQVGRNVLKVVEMQLKHGGPNDTRVDVLRLASGGDSAAV